MPWLSTAVLVYGILMVLGGVLGFVKGRSIPSLVAGSVTGILLVGCAYVSTLHPTLGFGGATILSILLEFMFLQRYKKTRKVIPSLALSWLSGLMILLLVVGHFLSR